LAVPKVAAPDYADDMPALTIKKAASDGQSGQNFIDSAFSLQGL
jgi:hypothetical protein